MLCGGVGVGGVIGVELMGCDMGDSRNRVGEGAGKLENKSSGSGAQRGKAGVESGEISSGSSDNDKTKAFVEFGGLLPMISMIENGRNAVAMGVEKFISNVGNGGVTRDEEGIADGVAKQGAFSINGMNIKREM